MSLIHNDNQFAHELIGAFTEYLSKSEADKRTYKYAVTLYPKYKIQPNKILKAIYDQDIRKNLSKAKGSTTLSAAAATGQKVIQVASATNFAVGDYVRLASSAITDSSLAYPIAWDNKIKTVDTINKRITLESNIVNQACIVISISFRTKINS